MAPPLTLMESFSQRERFKWRDNAFTIGVPLATHTVYHTRASQAFLKSILLPEIRLTRAGNISSQQPARPDPQPYDFYLAQLIHYGLDFHFHVEAAQRALEIEIILKRLSVPPRLVTLEQELKEEFERQQNKDHQDAVKLVKDKRRNTKSAATAVTVVESSEDEREDEPAQTVPPSKSGKRKKAKKAKKTVDRPKKSDFQTPTNEDFAGFEQVSDEEIDAFAEEVDDGVFSDGSAASQEVIRVAKRVMSEDEDLNNESSGEVDIDENSSDEDPFHDRRQIKRIKLELGKEQADRILRSTRGASAFVSRKQVQPSQAEIRRTASKAQNNAQLIDFATKDTVGNQASSMFEAPSGKTPSRKLFFDRDKRPSWTIPVRSPSSAQKGSPKSVTFSDTEPKTPTKVPSAEKAKFTAAMNTPQPDHGHNNPLRSILKKTTTDQSQTLSTGDGRNPGDSVQLSRHAAAPSSRIRQRKRKSGADPSRGLEMQLDGAHDTPDTTLEDLETRKPFIVSDLVNGKPVSYLKGGAGFGLGSRGGLVRAGGVI